MLDLLRRHVAWRFRAHPPATTPVILEDGDHADQIDEAVTNAPCTKCKRTVEDSRFKYCARCRATATRASKNRRRKRRREGACPKCGGAIDGEFNSCVECRRTGREAHHAKKADMGGRMNDE